MSPLEEHRELPCPLLRLSKQKRAFPCVRDYRYAVAAIVAEKRKRRAAQPAEKVVRPVRGRKDVLPAQRREQPRREDGLKTRAAALRPRNAQQEEAGERDAHVIGDDGMLRADLGQGECRCISSGEDAVCIPGTRHDRTALQRHVRKNSTHVDLGWRPRDVLHVERAE